MNQEKKRPCPVFLFGMALSTGLFSYIAYREYKELLLHTHYSIYPAFIASCFAGISFLFVANELYGLLNNEQHKQNDQ